MLLHVSLTISPLEISVCMTESLNRILNTKRRQCNKLSFLLGYLNTMILDQFEHWLDTSRKSSSPSLVNSYCRCTRKFMSSTEWTIMLMNCIQATWETNLTVKHIHVSLSIMKCFHAPTMKSMFPSSQRKYSISFSKRCFSLHTCTNLYLVSHKNTVAPQASVNRFKYSSNTKCESYSSYILTNNHPRTLRTTNTT